MCYNINMNLKNLLRGDFLMSKTIFEQKSLLTDEILLNKSTENELCNTEKTNEEVIRNKVINSLIQQGFVIEDGIKLPDEDKETFKKIQQNSKLQQLIQFKDFILKNIKIVKNYLRDGENIDPNRIELELRQVLPGTLEEILFKWWNIVWWSMPFQPSYGRQMKYILWDKTHQMPFGLILLQSPIFKIGVRDKYLEIPDNEFDIWINKSLQTQRLGALPPYNDLLGGKMVALASTSNEIRDDYKKKYANTETIIKKRYIEPELLFLTTTSAYGKSSIYNRLKYNSEPVAISLGYTKGSGTFHIPDDIYQELLKFLAERGIDISRGYGKGPSRKLRLIGIAFKMLGLKKFEYHGIPREVFLFPLAKNLKEVIKNKEEPIFYNRPFNDLVEYWKERWALPRTKRKPEWKNFSVADFFDNLEKQLKS